MRREREREKTRKENESEKEGSIARGARMARRGRELARISTIYTHVGGTAVAAAISSIFRFSLFRGLCPLPPVLPLPHSPACLLPWRNGSTGSRRCTFGQGLITVEGSPPYLLLTEKGSGLYLAQRTLPPLPRLFRSALPAIPLILLWNYDDGDVRARLRNWS